MSATTIPQIAKALQQVLTTAANRLARSSGFVQRESKLTGALFVQTLVFGCLAHKHPRWDQLAQTAATLGLLITGSGLLVRCNPSAASFLQQVLEAALTTSVNIHAAPVAIPILQRFTEVYLQDSTWIALPAALAPLWAGTGAGQAAIKLQTRLSYTTGTLLVALQAGRTNDHQVPAEQQTLRRGSLRLADLGYFAAHELARQAAAGCFWLTHVPLQTAAFTTDQVRWSLLKLLEQHRAQAARATGLELAVELGVEVHVPGRLLVRRLPRAVTAELQRRLWAQARDKHETVSLAQLEWTRWVVFFTNVPAERLTLAEALVLARVRWQIELLFKLWKSQGALDKSHHRKPYVILCQFYAKLLALLIQHWILIVGCWQRPERSLLKAAGVVRDHALALAAAFDRLRLLSRSLKTIVRSMSQGCGITKRKKVPATFQLLLALAEFPDT